MAKVTWLGEDALHHDDRGGPASMIWNGIKFLKGKAVEVADARMVAKARANERFFEVEGDAPQVMENKLPEPEPPRRSVPRRARKSDDSD